jgi:gliding motility-associated-like protein
MVQVQFITPGSVTLHGELTTTCAVITADKKIWSYDSIPIKLGNDTGICINASLTLDAGAGFISYGWNTGESTRQITVQTEGEYQVAAAYSPSCFSRDTLQLAIYDPKVNIGPDTSLCRNDTYTFRPNGVFNDYLWQDGSTDAGFTTDQTGEYWLQVEDNHHCFARDTAELLAIHELPEGFLPSSATICTDDYLVLKPESTWNAYLWSTGAVTDTTTIKAPGAYWLQVTDRFGCKGREDIIVVAADCRRDIYFPNAFTPNGDGNNDVFRPKVYGTLLGFYMVIFDRWGEKVFETKDAAHGWNGGFNGVLQPNGTFVWYASYLFSGRTQHQHQLKGTLTLVR